MKKLKLALKGDALLAAIECGLIPETNGKYDDEKFTEFWEQCMVKVYKRIFWKKTAISFMALIIATVALLLKSR